jgi:arylsulfatase A-like enzyme
LRRSFLPVSGRRTFLQMAALLPVGAALREDRAPTDVAAAASRPDFLVIVTDDMRDSDWQALTKTRQLVGDNGTIFPNFFTTTPICSPSRTSILTGQYAHNHQVVRNEGAQGGYDRFRQRNLGSVIIPTALRAAGYRTGLFGKFLNGMPAKGALPGGWDRWVVTSNLKYYRPQMNENGKVKQYKKKKHYSTDILRNKAVEFIRSTSSQQPLFLYFSPKAPHAPSTPARRHRGAFSGAVRERSPDFNEGDMSDKPGFLRERGAADTGAIDSEEARRLESLLATDDAVESLINALRDKGRLDNTYIFVMSDNGWGMGSHRWTSKDLPHNVSARIMMAASGPRFGRGATDSRLAANIDIAATIADAAGVSFGGDGVSLLGPATRDAVVLEAVTIPYSALRTERYLYVEYSSGERELYDYDLDPYELDNLLATWNGHTPTTEAETLAADLKTRLDALRFCAGSTCR